MMKIFNYEPVITKEQIKQASGKRKKEHVLKTGRIRLNGS